MTEESLGKLSQIDEKYLKHEVFSVLERIKDFYDWFSFSVFGFLSNGVSGIAGIDTYMFSSMQGTIDSMDLLLKRGRINDAYAILRKYHDSVISNIYSNIFLDQNYSLENFIVKPIDDWLNGVGTLPRYEDMIKYIEKSEKLSEVLSLFNSAVDYSSIRKICNDNAHYNYYYLVLHNDNQIYLTNRIKLLDSFLEYFKNIFSLHIGLLFSLSDHYMMSSNYRDAMDMGMVPEENSQYFVAHFIQEVFDGYLLVNFPKIAEYIRERSSMMLS